MAKLNQKGIIQLIPLLILVAGLIAGVYLVQQTQIFKPRARETNPEMVQRFTSQLTSAKSEYEQADQDKNEKLQKLIEIASQRKIALLEEVKKNPEAFLEHATLANQRNEFPEEAKVYIERLVTTEGGVMVYHADNFESEEKDQTFILSKTDGNNDLAKEDAYFNIHPTEEPSFSLAGNIISVDGVAIDNELAVKADNLRIQDSQPKVIPSSKRVAVFLVNFKDYNQTPFTKEQIDDLIFKSDLSLNNFLRTNSYGKFSITGDVFGWFTIDGNAPLSAGSTCSPSFGIYSHLFGDNIARWGQLADGEAEKQGIKLDNYNYVIYVFPDGLNCEMGGVGSAGAGNLYFALFGRQPRSYILSQPLNLHVYAHEFGHNLGLDHANSFTCGKKPIDRYQYCNEHEYGDFYSVMGAGNVEEVNKNLYHYSGPEKASLSWLSSSNIYIINQSGTYTISQLEIPADSQVIKIKKNDTNQWYYIEYRQPSIFSPYNIEWLTGVRILIGNDESLNQAGATWVNVSKKLLDPYARGAKFFAPSSLKDGDFFVDDINRIMIKQISHTSKEVILEINFNVDPELIPKAEQPPLPLNYEYPTPYTTPAGF